MVNAVILAGDCEDNGNSKALIKISSKYMVEYVIESLRDSGCVERILIVGNEALKEKIGDKVDEFILARGDILDNAMAAFDSAVRNEMPFIICTSDIPMVKGEAIRDFVEKCQVRNLEFGYPIIDKRLNDLKYPTVKRTYVKMKGGTYTGGNVLYIKPQAVNVFGEKARLIVQNRKNPLRMGRVLGFTFLIRLFMGRLSIMSVEKKLYKKFKLRFGAVITQYPEIGNDVDKPSDFEFVKNYIK